MKTKKFLASLLFSILLLNLVGPVMAMEDVDAQQPVLSEKMAGPPAVHKALAAPTVPPELSIPALIPAPPNGDVVVPVQFASNGNNISSLGFSIDYSNTWLDFDTTEPFSITFSLPPEFHGECTVDKSDADGEIDCVIVDPIIPVSILPDGVVASIRLQTLNAPNGSILPVDFSDDPAVSFGDDQGQYVQGTSSDGSILIVYPPAPPTLLTAEYNNCAVYLDWQDNSTDEDGFRIERKTPFTLFAPVGFVGPNVGQFTDVAIQTNVLYTYRVFAYNAGGDSSPTNEDTATTPAVFDCQTFLPTVSLLWGTNFSISGTVYGVGGSPLPLANVCAGSNCTLTNGSGDYTLTDLSSGSYFIIAAKDGYTCTPSFTNPVFVPPSTTGKNFNCSLSGYSISGYVRDNLGTPLLGAVVSDSTNTYSDISDGSGVYSISGLPTGGYHLSAHLTGYTCTPDFTNPVSVPPSAVGKNFTCSPIDCYNLILNGGFETHSAWEIPATEYTAGYSTIVSHSGLFSMRTGIVNPFDNRYSYSSARQLVSVPGYSTQAILRFFRFPFTLELFTGAEQSQDRLPEPPPLGSTVEQSTLSGDIQMVLLLDQYDNIISRLIWGLNNKQDWQFREFDLGDFIGSTFKVYFGTYNDGYGGNTGMFVDDVELEVCY